MSLSTNHTSANLKEMTPVHNAIDGLPHVPPEGNTTPAGRKSRRNGVSCLRAPTAGSSSEINVSQARACSSASSSLSLSSTVPSLTCETSGLLFDAGFSGQDASRCNNLPEARVNAKIEMETLNKCCGNNDTDARTSYITAVQVSLNSASNNDTDSDTSDKTPVSVSDNSKSNNDAAFDACHKNEIGMSDNSKSNNDTDVSHKTPARMSHNSNNDTDRHASHKTPGGMSHNSKNINDSDASHKTPVGMSHNSNNDTDRHASHKTPGGMSHNSKNINDSDASHKTPVGMSHNSNNDTDRHASHKTPAGMSHNSKSINDSNASHKTPVVMSHNSKSNSDSIKSHKTPAGMPQGSKSSNDIDSNADHKSAAQVPHNSKSINQSRHGTTSTTEIEKLKELISNDPETTKLEIVASSSPTTTRDSPISPQTSTPVSSRLSRIRQNNLASKKREQMKIWGSPKLPELAENSELDVLTAYSSNPMTNGSQALLSVGTGDGMPHNPDDNTDRSSSPLDSPVTPSLPDSFLRKLGLTVSDGCNRDNFSFDLLPEKEIESKFISLSLAFKSDKLTLDQRVIVQERARDLAEKNVDLELQALRDAAETLNELVTDRQVRCVLQKIKQHIGILEQVAARVSSRAEVYGAVQQEKRMCKAMEIMVVYTENLRRIREKEESELQEARKLLSEKSGSGFSHESESSCGRRSLSVCGFSPSGRPMRRRSDVTLPRIIGGAGSPSLNPTSNLDQASSVSNLSPNTPVPLESVEGEDPRSRFQSAVASTTMQQAVAATLRRCSMEKQRSVSVSSVSSPQAPAIHTAPTLQSSSSSTLSVTLESPADKISEIQVENLETGSKSSQEEEAFRKGFEEGLKAKLSQELSDLRNQQNTISQSIDDVMDKVDKVQMDDVECISSPSWFETTMDVTSKIRDYILLYDWRSNKATIRNLTGLLFLLLAFVVVFICPPISSVGIGRFTRPAR